jgi:hypothetical protein
MLRRKNVVEGSISVVVTTIVVEPHEGVECGVCSVLCTLHGRRIADEAADRTGLFLETGLPELKVAVINRVHGLHRYRFGQFRFLFSTLPRLMHWCIQGGIQLERGRISLPGYLNIFSHASHSIFKKTNSQKTVSYFLFFCFFLRSQFLRSQTLILTVKDLTYGMV